MSKTLSRIPLLPAAPGTRRELVVHRYGERGARPKAYLQASLHANEVPGMLVLHHLVRLLDRAAAKGAIRGEIVVVPAANPIGLGQWVGGVHSGRYELDGGGNFNRGWPDLATLVAPKLADRLDSDPLANELMVRRALEEALEAMDARDEWGSLRLALLRLAAGADIVLDLHCDNDALPYLYLPPAHWPGAEDLAAELGCRAAFLTFDSGGGSFDECLGGLWHGLAQRFGPDKRIPHACLASTVELRGRAEVWDETAATDAAGLFRFLQRRGLVDGEPGPLPDHDCKAVPFEAVDVVRTPATGIAAYAVRPGDVVEKGDLIAEIVDPMAEDAAKARTPVHCLGAGLVCSIFLEKFVRAGDAICKVVGDEPLPHRTGYLLED